MAHVRNAEGGCAIPALGAEIARAGLPVRETAEHWMLQLQQAWAEILEDGELAWAVISQCVGALVIARMLASEPLQEEVLGAGRQLLMQALSGAARVIHSRSDTRGRRPTRCVRDIW